MEKETIVCSALNYKGIIVCGIGQHKCIETILAFESKPDNKIINNNQGFITSTGRFVTREEAWIIAGEANQIKYTPIEFGVDDKPFLMSTNLFKHEYQK